MIHYYLDPNNCVYIYNSDTDHWMVKSPRVFYQQSSDLWSLNSGIMPEDLGLRKVGKTRAYSFLVKQYKDIEDFWEYAGMSFKTGESITKDESSYHIVYYLGNAYPVKSYRKITNTFILRTGKTEQIEVNVINCSEILRKDSNGCYSIYGRTII